MEGRADQPVPAMGRFLSAVAALLILAAAAPPRAAEKVPFAVHTRGLDLLRQGGQPDGPAGGHVDLEIEGGDGPYRVDTRDGSEQQRTATTWRWRAPDVPGLAPSPCSTRAAARKGTERVRDGPLRRCGTGA